MEKSHATITTNNIVDIYKTMLNAEDNVQFKVEDLQVSYDNQTQASTVKVELSLTIGNNDISEPVQVEIKLGTGMYIETFKHNDVALILASSKDALENGKYYYDSQDGILYFVTNSFSPFEVVYTDGRTVKTAEALAEGLAVFCFN